MDVHGKVCHKHPCYYSMAIYRRLCILKFTLAGFDFITFAEKQVVAIAMAAKKPFPVSRFTYYGDFRYYYAYGNTPAEDFLRNTTVLKEPNILLLGCGDMRSCFYTLWKNFRSGIKKAI